MANLSNINDKFLVTTTGEVLVGRTAATGTSKLQVSGSLLIGTDINSGIPLVVQETTADGFAIGFMRNTNATSGNGLVIDVNSTGGAYIQDWRQASTVKMRLLQNGNLGIGTDLPTTTLSVKGTSSNGINVIGVGTTATRGFMGLNASNHGYLFVTGASGQGPAVISSVGDSYISGGNFGIGTDSPDARLEVSADTGGVDSIVRFQNTNSTAKSTRIQLLDSAGTVGDALIAYDHSNANALLHYLGMGVNNSTTLVINNSDNVGIGTSSPTAKLFVDGKDASNNSSLMTRLDTTYAMGISNEWVSAYVSKLQLGRVGVGVSSNIDFIYDIAGTEYGSIKRNYTPSSLKFERGTTVDMIIDGTGNVGIGTTTVNSKLEIYSTATFDPRTSGINIHRPGSFGQYGSIAYNVNETVISSTYTGTGATDYGSIKFQQFNNGTVPRVVMYLNTAGNVGIGTTTLNRSGLGIDHKVLTVGRDTEMGMLELQGTRTSDADLGRIAWLNAGTRQSEIVTSRIDDNTSTKMSFRTSNAGSLSTKMTIAKDGKVGIGTSLPSSKLHVVGGATNSQHIVRGPYTVGISGSGVGDQPLSFAFNFNGLYNTGYIVEVYAIFNHWNSATTNYTYCYRKGVRVGYGAAGAAEITGPGGGVSDSASVGAWTFSGDNGGPTGYAQRILINKSAGNAGWNGTYFVEIVCSVPLDPTDVS